MPWKLTQKYNASQEVFVHELKANSSFDIVNVNGGRLGIHEVGSHNFKSLLARIAVEDWGIKLDAVFMGVEVQPFQPRSHPNSKPSIEVYKLKAQHHEGGQVITEIIFLREGDQLCFPDGERSLSCSFLLTWDPSEIHVQASAATELEVPQSDEAAANDTVLNSAGVINYHSLRDDVIITQSGQENSPGHRSPASPELGGQASVIMETPTAQRHAHVSDSLPKLDINFRASDVVNTLPPQKNARQSFSTVPTEPSVGPESATVEPAAKERSLAQSVEQTSDIGQHNEPVEEQAAVAVSEVSEDKSLGGQEIEPGSSKIEPVLSDHRRGLGFETPPDAEETTDEDAPERTDPFIPVQPPKHTYTRQARVEVQIPSNSLSGAKRRTPAAFQNDDLFEDSSPIRPSKRTKKTKVDGKRNNRNNEVVNTTPKTPASKKRRPTLYVSDQTDLEEDAPPSTTPGSRRSAERSQLKNPKVAFSNSAISQSASFIKFLHSHGGRVVKNVMNQTFDILCVRPKPLHKSLKVLLAVALGVPIVTDNWLIDSTRKGHFLAPEDYIPNVPDQEKLWSFSMSAIWGQPQNHLLSGQTVYFTPALAATYKPFSEIEKVCKAVGAKQVRQPKALKDYKVYDDDDDCIVLAVEQDDEHAIALAEDLHTCYHRDFLTTSILRGHFDFNGDEFQIRPTVSQEKRIAGRGRKKKKG
ncbi:hypothetical protein GQ43DRAFT_470171 [Delitschia confertaspora ATCC 74209]|uniref:BRCT domain-containing protein n=1 Tax=Delitschia confertaspora ATCC 74209 TaxID=1513339 RepID=A0A9P4JRU6_9PLEO|nr:hypothetical protein GQ43DRAFT_470171 [Delitschia confertaspora ATCC 74209]